MKLLLIFMNQKFQFMITLANDNIIVWPSSVTLTFNLPEQMFQMKNCAKLFWNPSINVDIMAWTSSIYDYFIIWPSTVTRSFKLPEQMFQMNNCATFFFNPCINVQVIVWTSSIYDHFLIWPSSVTLTFIQPEQKFQMALLLLKANHIILKSMHQCTSYGLDKLSFMTTWSFDL